MIELIGLLIGKVLWKIDRVATDFGAAFREFDLFFRSLPELDQKIITWVVVALIILPQLLSLRRRP